MAQKSTSHIGGNAPFFRLSNRHISASLRRLSVNAASATETQYGFSSLADLALYAMIGTVLSNPSFTYANGGLQNLLLRHTKNRYFSLHRAFRRLTQSGYLRRTRIPEGTNCFHDYYTLSYAPETDSMHQECLSYTEGMAFRAAYRPFVPPTEDYTEVSAPMLMDPTLSLGAKGLYIVIARYLRLQTYKPEIVLSKDMLRSVCKEGSNAFDRLFRELRCRGYLVLTRQNRSGSGYPQYLYTLNKTSDPSNTSPSDTKKQEPKEPTAAAVSQPIRRDPAVKHDASSATPVSAAEIRTQIEYPCLVSDYPAQRLDCIVSILQTFLSPPKAGDAHHIKILGVSYPREEISARMSALDSEDIRYVLDTYREVSQTQKIRSVRKYLTSCLFHAKENLAMALDAFAIRTPGHTAT